MSEVYHAAIARQILGVLEPHRGQHLELDPQLAKVHATLALTEQQRVANLIAIFTAPNTESFFDEEGWGEVIEDIKRGVGYEGR